MPLALADELFLMTHDLQSGKALVRGSGLGVGLACGLLAELMFSGSVVVSAGHLELGEYAPPADDLAERVYDATRQQVLTSRVTVRDWLDARRQDVEDLVADRLVRAGDLRRQLARRLGRSVVRYVPARPSDVLMRAQRLPSYLRHRVELTEPDVVVARLAQLLTPGGGAFELDDAGAEYLAQLVPALHPPARELLEIAESSLEGSARL